MSVLLCVGKADAADKSDRAISLTLNCNWIWLVLFRVHPENQHPTLNVEMFRASGYSIKLRNRKPGRRHPGVVQFRDFRRKLLQFREGQFGIKIDFVLVALLLIEMSLAVMSQSVVTKLSP